MMQKTYHDKGQDQNAQHPQPRDPQACSSKELTANHKQTEAGGTQVEVFHDPELNTKLFFFPQFSILSAPQQRIVPRQTFQNPEPCAHGPKY